MKRISLQHFTIIGLLVWSLPTIFLLGPQIILIIAACVLPLLWFARGGTPVTLPPPRSFGTTTCTILFIASVIYLVADALFGQKLFDQNLFLFGSTAVDRVVDEANQSIGEGRGFAALLGTLTMLLPFCLIDVADRAPRFGRWALWMVAVLLLFYGVTTSRALVLLAVMAIVLARTSNWRRILLAGGLAFAAFEGASAIRGDFGNVGNPMANGIATPYINLMLMTSSHCGSAPWYNFVLEFLKKFIPAFLFPKSVFSFNLEMSQCIYPTLQGNVESISIFTWMGEILYYKPSILTAIAAGILMGGMCRFVDRQLVKNRLFAARLYAGFACIMMPRSRVLDLMSFLIAQAIFLLAWPYLAGIGKHLKSLLVPNPSAAPPEPNQGIL